VSARSRELLELGTDLVELLGRNDVLDDAGELALLEGDVRGQYASEAAQLAGVRPPAGGDGGHGDG
jgi:hypothetical protein